MRPLATALAAAGFSVELPLVARPRHERRGHGPDTLVRLVRDGRSGLRRAFSSLRSGVRGGSVHGWLARHLPRRGTPRHRRCHRRKPARRAPGYRPSGTCSRACSKKAPSRSPPSAPTSPGKAHPSPPTTPRRSNRCSRCSKASTKSRHGLGRAALPGAAFLEPDRPRRADRVGRPARRLSAGGPVERIWLERSFHVATLDHDAPEIEARAVEFVNKLGRSSERAGSAHLARGGAPRGTPGQARPRRRRGRAIRRCSCRPSSSTSTPCAGSTPPTCRRQHIPSLSRTCCAPTQRCPCLDRESVLSQAPAVESDRFRVPRIMGEAP